MLWVFGLSAGLQAQAPNEQEPSYTFVLLGIPLSEAVAQLVDRTPINLIYRSELLKNKHTYCRVVEKPLEALLRCVLQGTNLDYLRLSSGAYMLIASVRTAPAYATITGQVIDFETHAPLSDAHVLLSKAGTATNRAGRFAFNQLKPGSYRIIATHMGYQPTADSIWVDSGEKTQVSIALKPQVIRSTPIVIDGLNAHFTSVPLGMGEVTPDQLIRVSRSGIGDVIHSLETVTGVQIYDATADIHIQGGGAGHHQYRLDNAPVFIPVHNGGFLGSFSPFAISRVTVHKAGFGVAEGSHLSGIIQAEHHLSWAGKPHLEVQLDPLSFNSRLTGGVGQEGHTNVAFMVSGRVGLWGIYQPKTLENLLTKWSTPDLFLIGQQLEETGLRAEDLIPNSIGLGFTDVHVALKAQRNPLHSLQASFYRGSNDLENRLQV